MRAALLIVGLFALTGCQQSPAKSAAKKPKQLTPLQAQKKLDEEYLREGREAQAVRDAAALAEHQQAVAAEARRNTFPPVETPRPGPNAKPNDRHVEFGRQHRLIEKLRADPRYQSFERDDDGRLFHWYLPATAGRDGDQPLRGSLHVSGRPGDSRQVVFELLQKEWQLVSGAYPSWMAQHGQWDQFRDVRRSSAEVTSREYRWKYSVSGNDGTSPAGGQPRWSVELSWWPDPEIESTEAVHAP